jgi:hypothetical protein
MQTNMYRNATEFKNDNKLYVGDGYYTTHKKLY